MSGYAKTRFALLFLALSSCFAQSPQPARKQTGQLFDGDAVASLFSKPSETRAYSYPEDKISFTLPRGWIEMTSDVLNEIREAANEARAGTAAMDYRHGFLPGIGIKGSCAAVARKQGHLTIYSPRAVNGPCAAYVAVQFAGRGHLSERDFRDPAKIRRMQGHVLNALDQKGSSINSSNVQTGGNEYDPSRHRLLTEFAVRGPYGMLRGISGIYLTSQGTIQVHCYASEQQFALLKPDFLSIISALKMDPSLEYHPDFWDRLPLPGDSVTVRLLGHGFVMLLGVVAVVWAVTRRRSSRPPDAAMVR